MTWKQQAYTKSVYLPLPVWAAELSGGGWMGPGPPHVKSRSYCSVERESFWSTLSWPTPSPPPHIATTTTSSSQSFQTQAEGVGCLDTAGGQAAGSDKDQSESSITGRASGSLPPMKQNVQTLLWLCLDSRIIRYYYDILQGWYYCSTSFFFFIPLQHIKRECSIIHATFLHHLKWYWLLEGLDHFGLFQLWFVLRQKGVNPQSVNPT